MPAVKDDPAFKYAFPTPAQFVAPANFEKFERFCPRLPSESPARYVEKLVKGGWALSLTSDEVRDVVRFRTVGREAEAKKLPICFLAQEIVPDAIPTATEIEAAKLDALAAARQAAGGEGRT